MGTVMVKVWVDSFEDSVDMIVDQAQPGTVDLDLDINGPVARAALTGKILQQNIYTTSLFSSNQIVS